MNQVVIFYNPFLPELKITVNGKKLSPYSSLMSFRHRRLVAWVGCLFAELYREVNAEYEMTCISNEFVCEWLEVLAQRDPHCTSFQSQPLPLAANIYERLDKLDLLGCNEADETVLIPVINISSNDEMTQAVYEVLEEQGIFEDITEDGITWTDCPLTTVEIKTYGVNQEIPYGVPVVIALCEREEDYIRLDTDAPIYAIVMGTETRFLKWQGSMLYFSVDPDDIGKILLGIIEEEALSPLLSQLSYQFPEHAREFLTENEKDELELVCQASPICKVSIPKACDVGRAAEIHGRTIPANSGVALRVTSDESSVIEVEGYTLHPQSPGEAEISVFMGEDPYPVSTELITVQQRNLIRDISLFPSTLCMPLGGESKLTVTIIPENGENADEIRWQSQDHSIATVDPMTGLISAQACGRCSITAYTQEASKTISIEVQPEIEDIICNCSFLELGLGEQKEWKYRVIPENAYGIEFLRAVSSNKSVAEYRGGYVIGRGLGECRIYIKNESGSISRELKVTVKRNRRAW